MKLNKCFLLLLIWANMTAQEPPKLGLVLSGGGAKGLAHIGVLKVIDSLGIKVDYIAGTSMGAVVGGLYASGYSGKQLEAYVKTADFDALINDRLPRDSKTFYEREMSERYVLALPFNNFKIQLPEAVSRGQNIFNLLTKMTLHVSEIESFVDLPIPFFCVATDIETGESKIFDSGNLSQAISASAAFPTLFQPVEVNGHLYIDGGVVDNYPIDALLARGVDVVIGVDVQNDLVTKEELNSATAIIAQINNYRTQNQMQNLIAKTDLYINPKVQQYSVIDFSSANSILIKGELAAKQSSESLKRIAKQFPLIQNQKPISSRDSIDIKRISIDGAQKFPRSYLLGKMKLKQPKRISLDDLGKGINNLMATNNFQRLFYEFRPYNEGYELWVSPKVNNESTMVKFAVHYDDLYKSAALVNLTQKQALFKNDVLSLDFILGENIRYNFGYYIDKGFYWSVGLNAKHDSFQSSVDPMTFAPGYEILDGVRSILTNVDQFSNEFYVQTLFPKDFKLTLGANHKRLKISSETISEIENDAPLVFINNNLFSFLGRLNFDNLDNKYFPTRGFLFEGSADWYVTGNSDNFQPFITSHGYFGKTWQISEKLVTTLSTSGGFTIGNDPIKFLNFGLGGNGRNYINNYIPFYGYRPLALIGEDFVKATIQLDYNVFNRHHIKLLANGGHVDSQLWSSGKWATIPSYTGVAAIYAIDTLIGPVEFTYTYSPERSRSLWMVNLGFWF
jgi:NTE family protein